MRKYIICCIFILFLSCNKKVEQNFTETSNKQESTAESIDYKEQFLPGNQYQYYNMHNLFEIKIPEEMEVISVMQNLGIRNDNLQYCIRTDVFVIYENSYLTITIRCYGNTNRSILNGTETYDMNKRTYYGSYDLASQVEYLFENFNEYPFVNKNAVKFSRFVSEWASGRTSDYYGIYFKLSNNVFNECIISINNIFGTFTNNVYQKLGINDKDYMKKALIESEKIYKFFQLLENIEDSIKYNVSNSTINILPNYSYEKYYSDFAYIYPTIDNLRMRNNPSLTGEISGFMENRLYETIIIGEEIEIDGIKGNWIRIKPILRNSLSWVFSGYTRKATEEEIDNAFEGS